MKELKLGDSQFISYYELMGELEKCFGKETITPVVKEVMKQLLGESAYKGDVLGAIKNVLGYHCTGYRRDYTKTIYYFIKDDENDTIQAHLY